MVIAGVLCWYDERPEFLTRCVRSLAGVVDLLITADGAWECYPDGLTRSPEDQRLALRTAARDVSIPRVSLETSSVWESQVAKRAALMDAATACADWALVIDADEYLARVDAREMRARLERTDLNVAMVEHVNMHRGWTADNPDPPRAGMNRRLYRAGTTVIVVHSGYIRYGEYLHTADAVDLRDVVTMEHDNWNRGEERNQAAKQYRRERERARVEVWQ